MVRSLLACLLFACGPRASTPPPTTVARTHTEPTPPPSPDGPSESECDALFTHVLALSVADRKPTDADRTALATELRPAFVADCRAGTRTYHACGLAAKVASDLAACSANAK